LPEFCSLHGFKYLGLTGPRTCRCGNSYTQWGKHSLVQISSTNATESAEDVVEGAPEELVDTDGIMDGIPEEFEADAADFRSESTALVDCPRDYPSCKSARGTVWKKTRFGISYPTYPWIYTCHKEGNNGKQNSPSQCKDNAAWLEEKRWDRERRCSCNDKSNFGKYSACVYEIDTVHHKLQDLSSERYWHVFTMDLRNGNIRGSDLVPWEK